MQSTNRVHLKVHAFRSMMHKAGLIRSSGSSSLSEWDLRQATGNPSNVVLYYCWEVDGVKFEESITEEMIVNAKSARGDLVFEPVEGEQFTLEIFECKPLAADNTLWADISSENDVELQA